MRRHLKEIDNSGFNALSNTQSSRILNANGTNNVKKKGINYIKRLSIYHTLLRMPRFQFILLIASWYTLLNLVFASIYYFIGTERLIGTTQEKYPIRKFIDAFFFSSQTLTTVGYGHVYPSGLLANSIASIESMLGIIMFAIVTGIFYGRFSRPKAFIKFSDTMLIAPFKDKKALMIRIASYKNNNLTEVEAALTLAIITDEHGKKITKYYPLSLDINKIGSLALSWTIVHPINEDSPFYKMSQQEIEASQFELLIFIKGFDDHFSNTVQQRTSYLSNQLVYGAKFVPMFHRHESGDYTVLEIDEINKYNKFTFVD